MNFQPSRETKNIGTIVERRVCMTKKEQNNSLKDVA